MRYVIGLNAVPVINNAHDDLPILLIEHEFDPAFRPLFPILQGVIEESNQCLLEQIDIGPHTQAFLCGKIERDGASIGSHQLCLLDSFNGDFNKIDVTHAESAKLMATDRRSISLYLATE